MDDLKPILVCTVGVNVMSKAARIFERALHSGEVIEYKDERLFPEGRRFHVVGRTGECDSDDAYLGILKYNLKEVA